MAIFALDPGSVATGLAAIYSFGVWNAKQYTDPRDALYDLRLISTPSDVFLLEDYRTGGHVTKDAKRTIEIVGFFKYSLPNVIMRVEQQRLSGVSTADEWMKARGIENPEDKEHKDARAALAHAIVYNRGLR